MNGMFSMDQVLSFRLFNGLSAHIILSCNWVMVEQDIKVAFLFTELLGCVFKAIVYKGVIESRSALSELIC